MIHETAIAKYRCNACVAPQIVFANVPSAASVNISIQYHRTQFMLCARTHKNVSQIVLVNSAYLCGFRFESVRKEMLRQLGLGDYSTVMNTSELEDGLHSTKQQVPRLPSKDVNNTVRVQGK